MLEQYLHTDRTPLTVILGGGADAALPLGELCETFSLGEGFCNRSADISLREAAGYYRAAVAPLHPARVIVHLGARDAAGEIDGAFRELIAAIRASNRVCRIGVVGQADTGEDPEIAAFNRRLRLLAESERCEFADIAALRGWDAAALADAMGFVVAMGARSRHGAPLFDLARVFFCRENARI